MNKDSDSIFGKSALVRPTKESFQKAYKEYLEEMRNAYAKRDESTVNPFRFLEQSMNGTTTKKS